MLCLPFLASSAHQRAATSPLLLANPQAQPERERLLHLVIGSPEGVRSVIHALHVLQYAEQATWSQAIAIPASGILMMLRPRSRSASSIAVIAAMSFRIDRT